LIAASATMGKANTQQFSYTSGEVSPLLRGRPDVAKYQSGAETVENFVVRPQGPLWKRSGTRFFGNTMVHANRTRLKKFEFSSSEAYLLEFGDLYLRIRHPDGEPEETSDLAAAINSVANNAGEAEVTTTNPHGWTGTNWVSITSSTVPTYDGDWQITVTGANTFILEGSTYTSTATAIATRQVVVATPWPSSILSELKFAQSADTMFITHKNYKPRKLTRTSSESWTVAEFTTVDGPYLDYNKDNIRLTVSSITDTSTVTANATMAAGANQFVAGDVGDWVEFMDGGDIMFGNISAVGSVSSATINMSDTMLLGIDPHVRIRRGLTPKGTNPTGTLPPSRSGNPVVDMGRGTLAPPTYRPLPNTPGIGPSTSPPRLSDPDALDPNAGITFGANIVSTHGNTFDKGDVGKHIRLTAPALGTNPAWYAITGITSHYQAAASALTMKTYSDAGGEAVTLNQNSRTISATLTASSSLFASTDVGRHIRMSFQGQWVYAKISAYTSATVVTISLYDSFPRSLSNANKLANGGRTDVFRMGAWYGSDGTGNYPSCVTFHEQRLVFAASPYEPQTMWFSRPQDFDKMSPSEMDGLVRDDSAINVTLASNKVNSIIWLQSAKVLLVGTIGGEWQGRAATSVSEPITPTNIAFTEETTHGSIDDSTPVKVGSAVLFLQRSGLKLRELTYNFELDGWASRDMTIASEHILRQGTKGTQVAFQNEPHSIIWCLTEDGALAGMTYQREQEVAGWHYHSIGGTGVVESIETIPASDENHDWLFMVVKRTVNGNVVRYIERMERDDYPASSSDKDGFYYLDSMITHTMSGSGTSWTAPTHLAGASVMLLKNGVLQGTYTASSTGTISGISYANNDVLTAGFTYTAKFKSLPIQGGSPYGSSDMSKKRVHKLFFRVYNSINCKHGRDESNLVLKTFSGTVGSEVLYTGDIDVPLNNDYGSDGVFHVQSSDPYPLILLGHVAQLSANE
jgi:hypothetical protein